MGRPLVADIDTVVHDYTDDRKMLYFTCIQQLALFPRGKFRQTDQSSPKLPWLPLALYSKKQQQKHPTAMRRLTGSLHIRTANDQR